MLKNNNLISDEIMKREVKPLQWDVWSVGDQEAAYRILVAERFDIALVDIRLRADAHDLTPDAEIGYATIRHLHEHYRSMKIIAVTAYDGKSEVNTKAIKIGADDFWSKWPDASENLLGKIRRLVGSIDPAPAPDNPVAAGAQANAEATVEPRAYESMDVLRTRMKKFAKKDVTILLVGETGTGKGYFAEEIHRLSHRSSKPFQVMNCPQQKHETIVSELFGHERGSFTDAKQKRQGLAASAVGGTLFLDEIEALDLECQAAILRFIDQKEIKPLGSNKTEVVDIRLIVATNRDLGKMVADGKFRDDLYSRLAGVVFEIPPLRARGAREIERLARQFYLTFKADNAKKRGFKDVRVSKSVWTSLAEYSHNWPGNVRELKQVIEATLYEAGGRTVRLDDFFLYLRSDGKVPSISVLTAVSDSSATLNRREQQIVQFIRDRGRASRGDVEAALHLRGTAAWKSLKTLVDKGLINREGSGRGSVYRMTDGCH